MQVQSPHRSRTRLRRWLPLLLLAALGALPMRADAELLAPLPQPYGEPELPAWDAPRTLRTLPLEAPERDAPFLVVQRSRQHVALGEPFVVDYLLHVPSMALGIEVLRITEPEFLGFWFREIREGRGTPDEQPVGEREIQGERYDVHLLRSYIVGALDPGLHALPTLRADVLVQGFFRDEGRLSLESPESMIEVRTPDTAPLAEDAHVAGVGRLEFRPDFPEGEWRAGSPRPFTLRASGYGVAALVELPIPTIHADAEISASEPRRSTATRRSEAGWPLLERSIALDITPRETGEVSLRLPALAWYDPWAGRWVQEEARSWTFEVAAAADEATPHQERAQQAEQAPDAAWQAALPQTGPPPPPRLDPSLRRALEVLLLVLCLIGLAPSLPSRAFSRAARALHGLRERMRRGRPRRILRRAARRRVKHDRSPGIEALRALLHTGVGPSAQGTPLDLLAQRARTAGREDIAEAAELLRVLERHRHDPGAAPDDADLRYRLRACARRFR